MLFKEAKMLYFTFLLILLYGERFSDSPKNQFECFWQYLVPLNPIKIIGPNTYMRNYFANQPLFWTKNGSMWVFNNIGFFFKTRPFGSLTMSLTTNFPERLF